MLVLGGVGGVRVDGFRGNDTFFLSFETSFEDFREPLDRSTETRYLSSWLVGS